MRADEQCTILASSENLDIAIAQLKKSVQTLDLDMHQRFGVKFSIAMLESVASYMRAQSNKIAETQP